MGVRRKTVLTVCAAEEAVETADAITLRRLAPG
jgi:hypothetical protein